jgi:hypothetical protein
VGHAAPGVVVHALLDVAGFGVHDQAHAAQVLFNGVALRNLVQINPM